MVQPVHTPRLIIMGLLGGSLGHLLACAMLWLLFTAGTIAPMGWGGYSLRDSNLWPHMLDSTLPGLGWLGIGASSRQWRSSGWSLECLGTIVLMLLLVPLTWRLVPTTLERCGVQRRHLARVWAYTAASLPFVLALPMVAMVLVWHVWSINAPAATWRPGPLAPGGTWGWKFQRFVYERWQWLPLCALAWIVLRQGLAFSRYLRLPRAWLVALLLGAIVFLVVAILGVLGWLATGRLGGLWFELLR